MNIKGVELTEKSVNGITLRVAEAGPEDGPLVILVHGWPELWYSWRYQIPALAEAGYRVIVPDMRGYGGSDAPEAIEAYDIHKLTSDVVGLIDAYGREDANLVGHDWGAAVAWYSVLLHPDRFNSLVTMSVPFPQRGNRPPTESLNHAFGDNFYYMLYFQEPGVAEAEFEADPERILKRLYASPSTPRVPPEITDPKAAAGGFAGRLGAPTEHPEWMSPSDLDYYVENFEGSGFHGGINYYRNLDRNWETTPELAEATIDIPTLFIAGEKDVVIGGATADQLKASMSPRVTQLEDITLYPNTGHWVQQEEADRVNADLLAFLGKVAD
ncbi:MAG: epoxide hydrolase [Ponticaulis sp.]|nr:epoxide hydrolase [Ponticaulis sp.]